MNQRRWYSEHRRNAAPHSEPPSNYHVRTGPLAKRRVLAKDYVLQHKEGSFAEVAKHLFQVDHPSAKQISEAGGILSEIELLGLVVVDYTNKTWRRKIKK